jgi:hypothetical protein
MRIALIGLVFCAVMARVAMAQTGGYPASPSHGVIGRPLPGGSLRYGREPTKDTNPSPNRTDSTGATLLTAPADRVYPKAANSSN